MNARTVILLGVLAGALVLLIRYRRDGRVQQIAADVIEEISVTAQRIGEKLLPRGIRNNNPGNIDWIENPQQRWRGMVARDGRFGVFDTAANGVRAIGRELLLSAERGARSVRDLIAGIPRADGTRWDAWAPPTENDTDVYVRNVARDLGVNPDVPIDIRARLPELAAAIIRQENGQQPYAQSDLQQWVYS